LTARARRFLIALPVRIACVAGLWQCYRIALADSLGRKPTEESLRAAVATRPNHFQYHWQLSKVPSGESRARLEDAIRLNPFNAGPMVDLATSFEFSGDQPRAEELLMRANQVDRTFFPRWSLANYYLRRGRTDDFWTWSRKAAEVGAENMWSLFALCHRVEPDPSAVARLALPDRRDAVWSYIGFLNSRRIAAPREVFLRAIPTVDTSLEATVLDSVDTLLTAKHPDDAAWVWNAAAARGVLRESLDTFPAVPSHRGLDWRYNLAEQGVILTHREAGLEVTISGKQSEAALILERVVVLDGASAYRVDYRYQPINLETAGGIRWRMWFPDRTVDGPPFKPTGDAGGHFRVETRPGERIGRLQFVCIRELGTTRSKGGVLLESARVSKME
jgi:hypothetical protein